MRNLLIGLFLGISLTAVVTTGATKRGPVIRGESGTLNYAIVVDGEVVCTDPWVSVPEKIMECDVEGAPNESPSNTPFIAE